MKRHSYVMMVDDDQAVLTLLNRILDLEGYSAPQTANGRAVLSLLGEHKPNLVMFDITIPELDDLEMRDLVKQGSSTPVIMLTAKCEVTTLQDARLLGGDDDANQPLPRQSLLARTGAKLKSALTGHFKRNGTGTPD